MNMKVELYKNSPESNPEKGKPLGNVSVFEKNPGYHVVKLNEPVDVFKNEIIYAVISGKRKSGKKDEWDLLLETSTEVETPYFVAKASAAKGQTYVNFKINSENKIISKNHTWQNVMNLPVKHKEIFWILYWLAAFLLSLGFVMMCCWEYSSSISPRTLRKNVPDDRSEERRVRV